VNKRRLSNAQVRALEDFAQPGGHGYGEYAYLSRPTARALEAKGLVSLTIRDCGGGVRRRWGSATEAGHQTLQEIRQAKLGPRIIVHDESGSSPEAVRLLTTKAPHFGGAS
jgi:hypothetical protein